MSQPSIAEFAQYRFVRDASGNVVSLPSQISDEKILLVLDCERWGFARLHIFEGAAVRAEKLEAFEEEMGMISALRTPLVSRMISWGRDGEELFYADEMRDGEPLPTYLGRAGKIPFSTASSWILRFLDLFATMERIPPSMERLTTLNFEVVLDRSGVVRPVFSEFSGWTKPGARVREHRLEWSLAQVFCSLIAGVPVRNFHRDSLPRNFDELPSRTREVILEIFSEDGRDHLATFREVMRQEAADQESGEGNPVRVAPPLMPLREWFRREIGESPGADAERNLSGTLEPGDEPYAIASRVRGVEANLQVLPGPDTLPREGWLNQHHDATRRPGRGRIHQLQVNYLEDLASVTLIGEEQVAGVDLASLLEGTGPLDFQRAGELGSRLDGALAALEKQTGACSVWWLPPENVLLLTGTRSAVSSAALIDRKGPSVWSELPIKLRLHQTVTTLMEGVDLPAKVRECSRLPGRQFEAARRSVVAIPMLWHLLTGTRFRWAQHAEHSLVPDAVAASFERYRNLLREDPEAVTENFFEVFAKLDPQARIDVAVAETEAETETESATEQANLGAVFEERLFEGDLDLPRGPEVSEATGSDEEGRSLEPLVGEGARDLDGKEGRGMPWGWIAVAAAVIAALVGFSLSGWAQRLGLFAERDPLIFTFPEFRFDASQRVGNARTALGEYLIAEGSPQSLRLLPLLDHLEPVTSRREIEPWLRHLVAKGDAGAARVMGMLSLAMGEANETAAGWFLEGARKGDADASFHYAALQWSESSQTVADSEAMDLLKRSATADHAPSQELYARVLRAGNDPAGAYGMLERAASKGWVPAIYETGVSHATGTGCIIDRGKAVARFRSAAEQGDERAMYDYGRCLSVGWGVTASFPEALRWIKLASARGHGGALRWLLDRNIDPNTP
jgi:hypothetical protein